MLRFILAIVFVACLSANASAQSSDSVAAPGGPVEVVFKEIEKRIVRDYLDKILDPEKSQTDAKDRSNRKGGKKKGRGKSLPPGLAKRDRLPPGLERQIERNGVLPPGLQTRSLPADLEALLPPSEPGTERVIVGEDLVLLRRGTNLILDVMKGVLRRETRS